MPTSQFILIIFIDPYVGSYVLALIKPLKPIMYYSRTPRSPVLRYLITLSPHSSYFLYFAIAPASFNPSTALARSSAPPPPLGVPNPGSGFASVPEWIGGGSSRIVASGVRKVLTVKTIPRVLGKRVRV